MQRPTGITVLAILYFLGGGLSLAVAAGGRMAEEAAASGAVPPALAPNLAARGDVAFWSGLLGTAASLFSLGAGAGLWTLQPWAWQLALVRATLKVVRHLTAAIQGAITPAGI